MLTFMVESLIVRGIGSPNTFIFKEQVQAVRVHTQRSCFEIFAYSIAVVSVIETKSECG